MSGARLQSMHKGEEQVPRNKYKGIVGEIPLCEFLSKGCVDVGLDWLLIIDVDRNGEADFEFQELSLDVVE
jgi:hypothetical protein